MIFIKTDKKQARRTRLKEGEDYTNNLRAQIARALSAINLITN